MRRRLFIGIGVVIFTFLMVAEVDAQAHKKNAFKQSLRNSFKNWYLDINLGSLLFYGDISYNEMTVFAREPWDYRLGEGIIFSKRIHKTMDARFQFLNGRLAGVKRENSLGYSVDEYFLASIREVNANLLVNISKIAYPRVYDNRFTYFVTLGAGMNFFRSVKRALFTDKFVNGVGYSNLGETKAGRLSTLVFPCSIGTNMTMTRTLSLNFEIGYRFTSSDKLDATVSGAKDHYSYVDLGFKILLGSQK
ncbi:MAG: hypothetical protein KKA07_05020 [Bacteroidetes bacterium]|nr:hypothetical protein [Bacteroidota bacterium]MBU1718414.1 hypothetical protein [Bacteroidota bacterium]